MHNALVDGLWSQITQNGRYLTYLIIYLLMGTGIFRPLERPVDSRWLQPIYSVIRTDFKHFAVPVFIKSIFKGTNPALKKPSNIPEIYAKMFGRIH